jgi:hypothetical protein
MENNNVFEGLKGILVPFLGEIMTKSTIKLHCKKLGLDPDHLVPSALPRLAEEIQGSLGIFVGQDKAKDLAQKILKLGAIA